MARRRALPSFLSEAEAEEYETMRRKYNERIRWHERKWRIEYGDVQTRAYMQGAVPIRNKVSASDLASRRDYERLRDWMEHTRTEEYRREAESAYREAFAKLLDGAYLLTPEQRRRVDDLLSGMSANDIVRYQIEYHPYGMYTIWDKYRDHVEEGNYSDLDTTEQEAEILISQLEEFTAARRRRRWRPASAAFRTRATSRRRRRRTTARTATSASISGP